MPYMQMTDNLLILNEVYILRNYFDLKIRNINDKTGFSFSLDVEDLRFKFNTVLNITHPDEWFTYGITFVGASGDSIFLNKDFNEYFLNIKNGSNSLEIKMSFDEVQNLIDFIKESKPF